ncbi:MAG TPA: hypothetical protein VG013_37055 [Gemmataceae bacterium]|nr:hypothetical protein [Gemmataceae bacterium]
MEKPWWLLFVLLAGLSWGVYVPAIAYGGKELKNSYGSFLCVGVAYFLIAIVVPIVIFVVRGKMPDWNVSGVMFATLAGVAGALGALGVIFATFEFGGNRLYVAPLIFGTAPIINTVVSLLWHPQPGSPFHFTLPETAPGWKLWAGIILAGLGAALVLYSKEEAEVKAKAQGPHAPQPVAAAPLQQEPLR